MFMYVLFTLLLLYTHYYSLFIVSAQGLVAFIFIVGDKQNQRSYFSKFAIAGALLVVGYLPWVPILFEISKIHSFWIGPIPPDFAITYFFQYFGDYRNLKFFLIPLMLFFFWQVSRQKGWSLDKIRNNPLQLMFLIFYTAIAVTYIIPYLRSIFVVPMLYNRYTIVVLPAFIISLAFAFLMINHRIVQIVVVSAFVFLSWHDLVYRSDYYSPEVFHKTQFREMTAFVSSDKNRIYPIVEERTSWHHTYYLKKYNLQVPVLPGRKEVTIDSILHRTSTKYDLQGFWIVGAHGWEPHLTPTMQTRLDSAYNLITEKDFFDTWAQFYLRKKQTASDP
ncbi:MAG TPA: hypothetical protein VIT44_05700, partial [Cyclobacteriaceae bacterium]